MTFNIKDIAEVFDTLASLCRNPVLDAYKVKSLILSSSTNGIRGLQTILHVSNDGIFGPISQAALDLIDVDDLITEVLAAATLVPVPVPVVPVPVTPTPVPTPSPIPTPTQSPVPNSGEYAQYFVAMVIDQARLSEVESIAHRIQQNSNRYQNVATTVGVTYWPLIGIIHNLESAMDFTTHLYNGNPLTSRTVTAPVGRPITGEPPFTWEYSAIDALQYEGWDKWHDWTILGMAYIMEKYNGFGYRHNHIPSPYLWAGSSIYTKGYYTRDGVFDPNAVSRQIGGMTMLKYFLEQGTT